MAWQVSAPIYALIIALRLVRYKISKGSRFHYRAVSTRSGATHYPNETPSDQQAVQDSARLLASHV